MKVVSVLPEAASLRTERGGPSSSGKRTSGVWLKAVTPYGLTSPAIVIIAALALAPAVYGVWLGFTNWQFLRSTSPHWEGVAAYRAVLTSGAFWSAFGHTWFWTIGTVIIEVGVGLPLGLLLSRPTKVSGVMTSLLVLPWLTPFVVVSYAWLYLLGTGGPLHAMLQSLGIVGQTSPLASTRLALPVMTVISGWKGLPFMTIALLAARRSIDDSMYEAAEVDGANKLQRFRLVTLPLLRNVLIVMSVVLGVLAFYSFDLVWLLTGGGPGSSSTISGVLIYEQFFLNGAPGQAAAMGVSLFVILLFVSTISLSITRVNRRGA